MRFDQIVETNTKRERKEHTKKWFNVDWPSSNVSQNEAEPTKKPIFKIKYAANIILLPFCWINDSQMHYQLHQLNSWFQCGGITTMWLASGERSEALDRNPMIGDIKRRVGSWSGIIFIRVMNSCCFEWVTGGETYAPSTHLSAHQNPPTPVYLQHDNHHNQWSSIYPQTTTKLFTKNYVND